MAKTKQFTIAVDNRPGAVAGIAKTLGNAKVNILSLLGTAQGKAGTVQLVVDDARRAKAQSLEKLAGKGVNLNSIHATAAKGGKKAVVVYTIEAAAQVATASA